MWIARSRRFASAALCGLLASPLLAQPALTNLQPADGTLLAARTGTLSGRAPGAVLLRVDGHELTLGGDGSFSYPFNLPEGESALSIYAEDAGGLSTSQVHHLEVDSLAPGIVVASPAQTRVGATPVEVAGTVQEPHLAGVTVRGSPASLSGNSFSSSVTLAEGAQNVAIVATDTLGRSSTVTLVLTLDTQAPTIGVAEAGTPFAGGLYGRPITPQITLGDAGSFTSEILLDGSPYLSGTQIAVEGAHQLEITATDAVGNSAGREIDFTLDFTAPAYGTISPAAGAVLATTTVTLQVEATGATGVKVGSLEGAASGGNVWQIGPLSLSEGSQELLIEAFDAAGNRAERRHILHRDTIAPNLQIVAPAQNAVLTSSPVTIAGSAADPRLASVRVGGELASLSGTNFSISKTLAEGANSFAVEALDSAGNASNQTLNLTLDTTAPSFTVKVGGVALVGGEVFSAAITPTIELSEPAATVTATLDGASFSFGAAISADGDHQLGVTVSHNGLSSSNLFGFRIDRQPPVFGNLLPAEGSVQAATSVLLEGSVQHAASLTVDGAHVALSNGAFTGGPYTLAAGLSRTFVLVATSAGGLTTEKRLTVVHDATQPQLAILQPAENALVGAATVSVSGTATDPHLLRVRVSGIDAQVSASSWLAAGVSLAEGGNSLTLVAEDRAGNQRQLTRTVVRDTTDPQVAITEPAAGTVVPAAAYTVRGTATDAHLDRVEVNGRRATLQGSSFSLEVALAEGVNNLEAVAIDKLGRRATATVSITRDSAAPQVQIQVPAEGFATRAASIEVRGAYENEAGTTVKVNGLVAVLTSGHFEAAAIPLVPGENRITARAVDLQGNEGVFTRTVYRDEVAPTFVRIEPAAGALALPVNATFRLSFSEELAAPETGAILFATAAGAPLGFAVAVEGKDLVLTPSAPLPPQTTLRLTLTSGLEDRAGNALSPVPAAFELTTADTGAPGAPVLTATPVAAACRRSVLLEGTAEAEAQVRAEGGAAAALTRADEAGAFSFEVQLLPEQPSVIRLQAIDALGNESPELVLQLKADCTPPRVLSAEIAGAVITVTFDETVSASAGAFRLASAGGVETFGYALTGSVATLTLGAAPSGLLELAVGEPGGGTVEDVAGNDLAFPWRRLFGAGAGDSFVAGTVFDDGKGQPLEGAVVSVTSTNGVPLADPLPRVTTAADGRFLLGLPAGTHDLTIARPGFAPVFRVVTTAAGEGTHVFDPRLTLLNLPSPIGAGGGEVAAGLARLELPAGAFGSAQATSITLLSEQALPALLPYGFSPRGAVYIAFDASLAEPGTLTLPVETALGREVVVARLDFGLLQWKALAIATVAGNSLEIEIDAPGAYVVVEADPESASLLQAVVGQVLPSLPAPAGDEIEAAAVDFSPNQVLPSQRSLATVSYTLADSGTPAPSGLPLTLAVQERLTLLDGSERRAVPYSADLLVFRAPNGEPRSRFWLQPSPLAASLPIEIGAEDVSIRTFGETTVRGNILGPDGGSVLGSQGDLLEVPAGALSRPTAVTVRRRTVGDLTHLAPAGFPVLGVLEVDLGGLQLAGVGRLTLATEDPPAAGSRGLLLGTEEIDGQPRWRALAELEPVAAGWRTVASGGTNPPWPGVRQGGLYLALELEGDWGLLEGELYDSEQELAAGGLISSVAVPWIQLSNADGTYVIPLPAGAAVVVKASDARRDQVSVEIPALADLERRVFDLEVLPTGPSVVEIEPADGAANVPASFLPRVVFSESIDRASLDEGIRLSREGEPVAIEIDHQDDTIVIDPVASLLPDTTYQLEIGTEVADLQGRQLASPRSVSFHTTAAQPPTPGIDATKLRLYEPDFEGNAKVIGLPGAVPAGSLMWVENAETITVTAEADGSFELEVPAEVGDELFLTVLVPGQSAAVRLLEPWLLRGDLGAYIGPKGGHFKTASGLEVEVQRDSFESLTRISLQAKPAPIPTPSDLQVMLDFELDLGGQKSLKPIFVSLPAPANPPANTTFLLSRYVEALGRRGWMAMDLLRKEGAELTNAELQTAQGSLVARDAGVAATRFENPLQRVVSAENMEALRQGRYLPKAVRVIPDEAAEALPRPAFESIQQKSFAGGLGLPGVFSGGHFQIASTLAQITWVTLPTAFDELVMFIFSGGRTDFLAVTEHSALGSLVVPIFNWANQVEVTVYDLTTGYQVYRQVQPPTSEPVIDLPAGTASDKQLPSVVEGSPLRFALVQTEVPGSTEVFPGITAIVVGDTLLVQGTAASTGPDTEIRLFDIDTENSTDPATGPRDATVRAGAGGEFTVSIADTRGRRFLLALGARIGPTDKLTLRFSETVPSVEGIELHRVSENGTVNPAATALASKALELGIVWQLNPVSGWKAGKYQLWITDKFGDNPGGGPNNNNTWNRKFTLELEVSKSASVGDFQLTRFANFARLGNLLAIADNDGGLRLYDVSDPAEPSPFLSSAAPYRFPGVASIRGVAIDSHGRVVITGGGEQFRGLLHVIDPLVMDREAPAEETWPAGVWGHTSITNALGEYTPFQISGLPRNVATMNNDRVNRWQAAGSAAPAGQGFTVAISPIPGSDEQDLTVTGTGAAEYAPVSLRNQTRGRWGRVYADENGAFSVPIKARAGDLLELRRGQNTWAYVSIDNRGIAMVNVDGSRGGPESQIETLALVRYTEGFYLDSLSCDESRPLVDPTPTDLEVVIAENDSGAPTTSLVTLVQGYGLALYQIDPAHPANLTELSSACAAVDRRATIAGMEVVANYPIDLDGDGHIRERTEIVPEVGLKKKEIRSYAVVAHARGHVLVFDITDPANPRLVSRIPIGKPGQTVPISGVTVDRVNRKIYVGAFGNGLYSIDFNTLGSIGLQDTDQDQLDDRITENIQVGSQELVDTLAFPELGIIWAGGRTRAYSVAVGGPQLKIVAADGGPIREVSRLAPLGVPTAPEGGKEGNPKYPAAFQAQVTVGSAAPELAIEVASLGPTGFPIGSAGTEEFLPKVKLEGDKAVKLERQADNPWEEGSTLYLSKPVVSIADLRAMIAFQRTTDENEACVRCDQVAEHLYNAQPLPANYLPEILSGHYLAINWKPEILSGLRSIYGNLVGTPTRVPSVPWEMSPGLQQEPAMNPSTGSGDVAPGTLLHSGEYSQDITDLAIPGLGFDWTFIRTYRNQTIGSGPLGPGWDHSWNLRLRALPNDEVELYDGRGRRDLISTPFDHKRAQLKPLFGFRPHPRGYVLTDQAGNNFQFDSYGRLLSIVDTLKAKGDDQGSSLEFSYDAESRLASVANHKRLIALEYEDGRISRLRDFTGREWQYHYDAKQRLVRVENPPADLGAGGGTTPIITTYHYVAPPESGGVGAQLEARDDLDTIVDARGLEVLDLGYEVIPGSHSTRVKEQQMGGAAEKVTLAFGDYRTTTVTDRRNFVRKYEHDPYGHLSHFTDPLNRSSFWQFALFEEGRRNGLVRVATLPDGRSTYFEHEEPTNGSSLRRLSNLKKVLVNPRSTSSPEQDPDEACAQVRSESPIPQLVIEDHHEISNAPGRLVGPTGQSAEIHYDQAGKVEEISVERGEGSPLRIELDNDSYGRPTATRIEETTGNDGRTVVGTRRYDTVTGYLQSESTTVGGTPLTTRYQRDDRGNVTSLEQPGNVVTRARYNELDWLLEECSDATGQKACTRYEYNQIGLPVRILEPFGGGQHLATRFVYGPLGEILETHREVKPGGPVVTQVRSYDANLNVLELDATGRAKKSFTYDDAGQIKTVTEILGNNDPTTTTYTYNDAGQVTSVTDGQLAWTTNYDVFGRPAYAKDPHGNVTYWHYDINGQVVHEALCNDLIDEEEALKVVTREFDSGGQLLEEIEQVKGPGESTETLRTAFGYDNRSRIVALQGPDNAVKQYRYDETGRVVREAIPGLTGGVIETRYLDNERRVEREVKVGDRTVTTATLFNGMGLPIQEIDGAGQATTHTYDDAGNRIGTQLPGGAAYFFSFDGLGRPLSLTQPEGIAETFTYVDRPDTVEVTYRDALNHATTMEYGSAGELLSTVYPDAATEVLTYDNRGNLSTIERPGLEIEQTFDQFDRLISRIRSDGEGPPRDESYAWDVLGRPTQATVGPHTTSWIWDSASRLRRETQGSLSMQFTPFPTGAPGITEYPSGLQVTRGYNAASTLGSVAIGGSTVATFTQAGAGLSAAQIGPVGGQFTYDAAGRLQRSRWAADQQVLDESRNFDAAGLPLARSRADLAQQWTYAYDQAKRLQAAHLKGAASSLTGEYGYRYDTAQNLLRQRKTSACGDVAIDLPADTSGRNRPAAVAGDLLEWDDRGRLTAKRDLRFSYDDRDRLVEVRHAGEGGAQVAAYFYDIYGRRVKREAGEQVIRTVWDGWQSVEDYSGTTLIGQRVYGAGLDQMLQLNLPLGSGQLAPYYPVYDSLGNLSALVKEDGYLVERYDYGPYGGRLVTANDNHPPVVEQVRLEGGELRLQLSEPNTKLVQLAKVTLENLTRLEQPLLQLRDLSLEGRQSGRLIAFKNGGDPNEDPPTWPQPGEHVRLVIQAGTFEDLFGNASTETYFADLVWPDGDGVLADTTPPRIEEICSRQGQLKLTFSEPVSSELAATVLEIDGQAVTWETENGGYTLKADLEAGSHVLLANTAPLDLAGLGLSLPGNHSFATNAETKLIFSAAFPGGAATSLVGNPYGFHGLPEDPETGFLYVRNRYYDPELGRFITPDPMGYVDGPSQYQFALNNPTVNRDPLGLSAEFYFEGLLSLQACEAAGIDSKTCIEDQSRMNMATAKGSVEGPFLALKEAAGAIYNWEETLSSLWFTLTHPIVAGEQVLADGERWLKTSSNEEIAEGFGAFMGGLIPAGSGPKILSKARFLRGAAASSAKSIRTWEDYLPSARSIVAAKRSEVGATEMFAMTSRRIYVKDGDFVRFDPTVFDGSIDSKGVLSSYFKDNKVWLTKFEDVKGITNAADLEKLLYRRNLWPGVVGKFKSGATLRLIRGVADPVPSGIINRTGRIRQWHTKSDLLPADLEVILRIPGY